MAGDFALERTQVLPRPVDEVFAFFARAANLEAVTPGWLRFHVVEAPDRLERGSTLRFRLRLFGVPVRWTTEIPECRPPRTFTDVQVSGPYPLWMHTHRFTPVGAGTEVYDHVRYRLPGGPLAGAVDLVVARWLDDIFDYRRERLAELFAAESDRAGTSVANDASAA